MIRYRSVPYTVIFPDSLKNWAKTEEWLTQKFGDQSSLWEDGGVPGRWYLNNSGIWFRDDDDVIMFKLQWP